MAVRCFARRWLVPARHVARGSSSHRRPFASEAAPTAAAAAAAKAHAAAGGSDTAAAAAVDGKGKQVAGRASEGGGAGAGAGAGVDVGAKHDEDRADGFFFSRRFGQVDRGSRDLRDRAVRDQIHTARKAGISSLPRALGRVSAAHPLVKELVTELYSSSTRPSPEKVWRIYMDIHQRQSPPSSSSPSSSSSSSPPSSSSSSAGSSGSSSPDPALLLHPEHHQLVLRAIAPDVAQARIEQRRERQMRAQNRAAKQLLASLEQQKQQQQGNEGHQEQEQEQEQEQQEKQQNLAFAGISPLLVRRRRFSPAVAQNKASQSIRVYLQRVAFVFAQLRNVAIDDAASSSSSSASPMALPSAADYNHVLKKLAPTGHMPVLAALWSHLSGWSDVGIEGEEDLESITHRRRRHWSASILGTGPSSSSSSSSSSSGPASDSDNAAFGPTAATYKHMMLGISRHLSDSIQRAHKDQVTRNIWHGQGKARKWKVDVSARAAAQGMGRFGQEPPRQARRAVALASKRAAALLDDMRRRSVPMQAVTLDLAARLMRLSGNVDGIRALLAIAHGYDVRHPDAAPLSLPLAAAPPTSTTAGTAVSSHTLNTVLMALGEQATVTEMVTAYETLTRPMPTARRPRDDDDDDDDVVDLASSASASASNDATGSTASTGSAPLTGATGGLFATDFRGLFRDGQEEGAGSIQSKDGRDDALPDVMPYPRDRGVAPTTFTLKTLLKHATTVPDPTRMVAEPSLVQRQRQRQQRQHTEAAHQALRVDHEARRNGAYLPIASYLVCETVDLAQDEVARVAHELGVAMPDVALLQAELASRIGAALRGSAEAAPINEGVEPVDGGEGEGDGQAVAGEGQVVAEEGRTVAEEGRTVAEEGRTVAEEGRTVAEEGQTLAETKAALLASTDPIADVYEHLSALVASTGPSDIDAPTTNFVPLFEPPRVELTYDMVQSLLSLAKRRNAGSTLRLVRDEVQRALAVQLAQLHVLRAALLVWTARRDEAPTAAVAAAAETGAGVGLTRESLAALVAALDAQQTYTRAGLRRLLEDYWQRIEALLYKQASKRRRLDDRKRQRRIDESRDELRRKERARLDREEKRRLESIVQQSSDVEQQGQGQGQAHEAKVSPVPVVV